MRRLAPALLISLMLHVGVLLLAFVSFTSATKDLVVSSSVPVEIITEMPSFEQAEAPVDELAVKPPEPIPAPEEPVPPQPKPPEPVPPKPVPTPQKEQAKTPPKKADKTPPDKNGTKKPQPKKAEPEPDLLGNILDNTPSKSQTKRPAQANTQRTDGASNKGNAPQDTGLALNALTAKLIRLWSPTCDVPGAREVEPDIRFTLSPNGRVIRGPEWANRRNDPLWEAGAQRAISAVKRGEPYDDLPEALYNRPLVITFEASKACR